MHPAAIPPSTSRCLYLQVYREAVRLYRFNDRTSRYSEWPHLRAELLEASRAQPSAGSYRRLAVVERMMRTYAVFER